MCYLQEVRCTGQGASMLGMKGRRYNLGGLGKEIELVLWELL